MNLKSTEKDKYIFNGETFEYFSSGEIAKKSYYLNGKKEGFEKEI